MWMNEHDIDEARSRYSGHPVLGPATATLFNLKEWTNSNSDGWPYWAPPGKAAEKLMALIHGDPSTFDDEDREDATEKLYRAALTPLRAFRTRRRATFTIVEPGEVPDMHVPERLFRIEIETGNSAFGDKPGFELERLLRKVAEQVREGRREGPIVDANGLRVGTYWFEDGTAVDADQDR